MCQAPRTRRTTPDSRWNPAANVLRTEDPEQGRVGEAKGEPGDREDDEADEEDQVLAALRAIHALHGAARGPVGGADLAVPGRAVVQAEKTDNADDQGDVETADPAVHHQPGLAAGQVVEVNPTEGEVGAAAGMALAARLDQIGGVDRGRRIGGREDVVPAVAAGAVGGPGRSPLGGESVIAVEEGVDLRAPDAEPGVEPFRSMAAAADLFGDLDRRGGAQVLDLMLGMAVNAGGRVASALGGSLPVHARLQLRGFLEVTLTARRRQMCEVGRRIRRGVAHDVVVPVAVLAGRRRDVPAAQRDAMRARIGGLGLLLVADGAVHRLGHVTVVGMLPPGGQIPVAVDAGVRPVNRGLEFRLVRK